LKGLNLKVALTDNKVEELIRRLPPTLKTKPLLKG
jgi:hypothetical protein